MATKKSTTVTKSAVSINLALLAVIASASASEQGYGNVSKASAEPLEAAGLVQINPDAQFADADGNPAVRITDAGKAKLAEAGATDTDVGGDAPNSNNGTANPSDAVLNTNAGNAAEAPKAKFAIVSDVPLPAGKSGGRGPGTSAYPFDKLEIGQSFFVPASESKPNPAKSLASTVTSANEKYSEEIPGQTRINKKQAVVPATRQLRTFTVRAFDDGTPWGHPGVKGAAVFRIANEE